MSCSECYQYKNGNGCEFVDYGGDSCLLGDCEHYIFPCARPYFLDHFLKGMHEDTKSGFFVGGILGRPRMYIDRSGEVYQMIDGEYMRVGHNVLGDICRNDSAGYTQTHVE